MLGFAFAAISAPAFGQSSPQETPNLPSPPVVPRPYSFKPPPATGKSPTEAGAGLPFRNWQDLLDKDASSGTPVVLKLQHGNLMSGWGATGHCSVPLIEMPIPDSFDEPMVMKMPPHRDDKMALAPPPVCPLRGAFAKEPKHK